MGNPFLQASSLHSSIWLTWFPTLPSLILPYKGAKQGKARVHQGSYKSNHSLDDCEKCLPTVRIHGESISEVVMASFVDPTEVPWP